MISQRRRMMFTKQTSASQSRYEVGVWSEVHVVTVEILWWRPGK